MFKVNKLTLITLSMVFLIFFSSSLVFSMDSGVRFNYLLTTNGLDSKGLPLKFKREFSLREDPAVQYYVSWKSDNIQHRVLVKWIDPKDRVINQLQLFNFKQNIVKSYISLKKKAEEQLMVPDQIGTYAIKLYIDGNLAAITRFKIKK